MSSLLSSDEIAKAIASPRGVAKLCGVSWRTVWKWHRFGILKPVLDDGHVVVYALADVRRLIADGRYRELAKGGRRREDDPRNTPAHRAARAAMAQAAARK